MTRPLHRPLWESYRFLLDDEPIYVGPAPRSKRLWERPWVQVALFAAAIALAYRGRTGSIAMTHCAVVKCFRPMYAKGLCHMHYLRVQRHGSTRTAYEASRYVLTNTGRRAVGLPPRYQELPL